MENQSAKEWAMEKKKTLVLGASENPSRYSYLALNELVDHGHPVVAIGKSSGRLRGVPIQTGIPYVDSLHTVTLYLNPRNQKAYQDYVVSLKPQRVIFNPGTENPEWESQLMQVGISVVRACTLVLLKTGAY